MQSALPLNYSVVTSFRGNPLVQLNDLNKLHYYLGSEEDLSVQPPHCMSGSPCSRCTVIWMCQQDLLAPYRIDHGQKKTGSLKLGNVGTILLHLVVSTGSTMLHGSLPHEY